MRRRRHKEIHTPGFLRRGQTWSLRDLYRQLRNLQGLTLRLHTTTVSDGRWMALTLPFDVRVLLWCRAQRVGVCHPPHRSPLWHTWRVERIEVPLSPRPHLELIFLLKSYLVRLEVEEGAVKLQIIRQILWVCALQHERSAHDVQTKHCGQTMAACP